MENEFKGSRAFLNIPAGIAHDKELLKKPKSIILMGEIVSMLNVTGKFFMSNSEIAKRLDCTPRAVANYLTLLENKDLIRRTIVYDEDKSKKAIKGRYITAGDSLVNAVSLGWGNPVHEGSEHNFTRDSEQGFSRVVNTISHKENNIKEQSNRAGNRANSVNDAKASQSLSSKVNEVLTYLNEKTGKHFSTKTESNKRGVRNRLKEGFTVDQCKKVIDKKFKEWHGVEFKSNGQMGDNYLTPQTLFRQSNFERYLNETPKEQLKKEADSNDENSFASLIEEAPKTNDFPF